MRKESTLYDIIVIGGGPAGLAAAINVKIRNKSVLVLTNDYRQSYLYQAPVIENYPGRPGISGAKILEELLEHAKQLGVELAEGRALNVMPMENEFYVSFGANVETARQVILAIGTGSTAKLPGETELVGRGISYCATCDGMLYRNGKRVTVVGKAADAVAEANYLNEIGCQVTFVSQKKTEGLSEGIVPVVARQLEVKGKEKVTALIADGTEIPSDGVFILRQTVAPTDLLPQLSVENGGIMVSRRMETSIQGVYAAGDCTGRPLQISKAMGEGQAAALYAVEELDQKAK